MILLYSSVTFCDVQCWGFAAVHSCPFEGDVLEGVSGVGRWLPVPEHIIWGSNAQTFLVAVGGFRGSSEQSEGQRACTDLLERAERGASGVNRAPCNSDSPKIVWKGLAHRGKVCRESIAYNLPIFLFCLPLLLFYFSFIMLICIQMKYGILVILADIEEGASL